MSDKTERKKTLLKQSKSSPTYVTIKSSTKPKALSSLPSPDLPEDEFIAEIAILLAQQLEKKQDLIALLQKSMQASQNETEKERLAEQRRESDIGFTKMSQVLAKHGPQWDDVVKQIGELIRQTREYQYQADEIVRKIEEWNVHKQDLMLDLETSLDGPN